MGLNKDELVFTSADGSGDNVGAYIRAGDDGDQIASQAIAAEEWLNTAAALHDGSANAISSTGGSLDVNITNAADIQVEIDAEKAEDSAHVSGDIGMYILGVRQDSIASSVDTDGDYGSLKINSVGRLYTDASISSSVDLVVAGNVADDAADSGNPVKTGTRSVDQSSALTAISAASDRADMLSDLYRRQLVSDAPNIGVAHAAVSVGIIATALPTTALAGRQSIILQNASNAQAVFVGGGSVTTANGLEIPKRGSLELKIGESIGLSGIVAASTASVIVFELA